MLSFKLKAVLPAYKIANGYFNVAIVKTSAPREPYMTVSLPEKHMIEGFAEKFVEMWNDKR